jgi:hypothetical protein
MAFNVNPRIGKTASGQAPRIIYGRYETNSLSFKAGMWVLDDGDVAPGTACITGVVTSGTLVLGIAMKDATNVTTGNIEIPVMELRPGDEIYMPCVAGTTAAKSNTFLTQKRYGLYVSSTAVYANSSNTTDDIVLFKEPIYDANGDSTYWGLFELFPAGAQVGIGVT